jgi:hypothetical protein
MPPWPRPLRTDAEKTGGKRVEKQLVSALPEPPHFALAVILLPLAGVSKHRLESQSHLRTGFRKLTPSLLDHAISEYQRNHSEAVPADCRR